MFDVSFIGAFLAGLVSFLSPCVLPMVPFYLSYLAGVSMHAIADDNNVPRSVRRRSLANATAFSLGILTVFVALGASATLVGQLLRDWFDVLRWVASAALVGLGLHFLGVFRIGLLDRSWRVDSEMPWGPGLAGAYAVGLAFAFGWTPCVGPILAAILFSAAGADTAGRGAALLFVYGAGMTLPFVLASVFVAPFMRFMAQFRHRLGTVERVTGAALVLFGVLIATNTMNRIGFWMLDTFDVFRAIG